MSSLNCTIKFDISNLHRVAVRFCHPPSNPGIMKGSRGHIVMDNPEFLSDCCSILLPGRREEADGGLLRLCWLHLRLLYNLGVIFSRHYDLLEWVNIKAALIGFLYHSNESSRSFLISWLHEVINRWEIQSFPLTVN